MNLFLLYNGVVCGFVEINIIVNIKCFIKIE